MDLSKYVDVDGFIVDYNNILNCPEYDHLNDLEKQKLLIEIISLCDKAINRKKEHINYYDYDSKIKDLEKDKNSNRIISTKEWIGPQINSLFQYDDVKLILNSGVLPNKDNDNFKRKMNELILAVRLELESYKSIKLEDQTDLFKIERQKCEELLDFLVDYSMLDDDVEIDVQNDFTVFYIPDNDDFLSLDNLSPIIKDISKSEQKENILDMIESIKMQTFKGIKRFSGEFSRYYELRNGQERVVFHFLTKKIAIIVSIYTKKTNWDKKNKNELFNRISRYERMEKKIKKAITSCDNNSFLQQQLKIDEIINNFRVAKVLEKGEFHG